MFPIIKNEYISIRTDASPSTKLKRRSSNSNQSFLSKLILSQTKTPQIHKPRHSDNILQSELSLKVKQIDKQIRKCEKKIRMESKRKQKQNKIKFINNTVNAEFEFLTNVKGNDEEEEERYFTIPTDKIINIKQQQNKQEQFILEDEVLKMERGYMDSLKKKFHRRTKQHHTCKRKVPKLYITQRNKISKHGRPLNEKQHLYRVMSKQITPTQIYPSIPVFPTVKNLLSKSIISYLHNYKPFLQNISESLK